MNLFETTRNYITAYGKCIQRVLERANKNGNFDFALEYEDE